jgi:AAA+ ATPase superfamily predicted ATPase
MNRFVNRVSEIESLNAVFSRPGAALYVLYGRRRMGKTTLLRHFVENHPGGVYHVADRAAEPDAIRLMAASMASALNEPTLESSEFKDWYSLFAAYDRVRPAGKSYLILDEFQYLCEVQPAFSSIIQRWWDEHWSRQDLMVVLCGSVISMMYKETLSRSSPLYGRRSGQWLLRPLRLPHVAALYSCLNPRASVELFTLTGGVPRYAELCTGFADFSCALDALVLLKGGPLYDEARFLLQDEVTVTNVYWSLLHAIGCGASRISEIAGRLGLPANQLTRYLSALQDLGFIRREVSITEPDPSKSKRGIYRIDDPFLRLWFGCVASYESLLEFGRISDARRLMAPRLATHQAEVFEGVCRQFVEDRLAEVGAIRVGRYWDRTAEIDVVAVGDDGAVVLAGECKWMDGQVGVGVLEDLRLKAVKLWPDRIGPMTLAVFSGGGFTDELQETAMTDARIKLIDCAQLVGG